jgi:hypothetical protein
MFQQPESTSRAKLNYILIQQFTTTNCSLQVQFAYMANINITYIMTTYNLDGQYCIMPTGHHPHPQIALAKDQLHIIYVASTKRDPNQ